ncbi:MAG: hypothetical protein UY96_C0017G0058 [Parcubacteria group bacterium GW2011_GWB1_56_8]|nr:MAG: hypothetical protein UY96_C0017G0058 [Parcubacteria group bacterium GW2011_GWB1_56_8]
MFNTALYEVENAHCVQEKRGAILVDVDGEHLWFSKAEISDVSEVQHLNDRGNLVVAEAAAQAVGLL